jgi:hypothetical protein
VDKALKSRTTSAKQQHVEELKHQSQHLNRMRVHTTSCIAAARDAVELAPITAAAAPAASCGSVSMFCIRYGMDLVGSFQGSA